MTPTSSTTRTPRAGRREWAGLAVLTLPSLLIALDLNALFLALPQLSTDLGASATQQLWILDSYGFLLAGFLITMGNLGDRIGRRRLLLIGVAAFGLTSLAAAYATDPTVLIAARALMGVAAATLTPSTLALISNMFTDNTQRATAIAIWATTQFAGAALGPVLTGILLQHFWWGSVFLLNAPVMLILLIAGPLLLPEHRNPGAGRMDPASVALSLATLLPLVYGLKQIGTGDASTTAALAIAAGALCGVLFARRQLRLPVPLLDLGLFARRSFTAVLATLLLTGTALAGAGLVITQYLQSVAGHPPARAALLFAPMGLALAAGTMIAPLIARRIAPGTAIAGGLVVSAAGFVLLTGADHTGGLPYVIGAITLIAVGTGPLFALGTGLVMASVPRARSGAAASMSETSNLLGGTLGIALLGTLSAAVYQQGVRDATDGLPTDAARAATQTLAGAVAVAADQPSGAAHVLLTAARDAYTDGLTIVGLGCAVLFLGLATLVAAGFRATPDEPRPNDEHPRHGSAEHAGPDPVPRP